MKSPWLTAVATLGLGPSGTVATTDNRCVPALFREMTQEENVMVIWHLSHPLPEPCVLTPSLTLQSGGEQVGVPHSFLQPQMGGSKQLTCLHMRCALAHVTF